MGLNVRSFPRVRFVAWGRTLAILSLLFSISSCSDFFVDPQISVITVNPATPSVLVGETVQFTAIATYDNGTREVLGSAAWTTSNSSILLVNQNGLGTAVAAGSATVTATSGTGTGSTTVTVTTAPLTSIAVTPLNPSVSYSSQTTVQFTATATHGDGSTQDITNSATWSSSDTGKATINPSTGLATLTGTPGTTTIKATSGTVSGSSVLTITP